MTKFFVIAFFFASVSVFAQNDSLPIRLKEHVTALCSTEHARNFKNIKSLKKAGDYIERSLAKNYVVQKQNYKVEDHVYTNFICLYGDSTLPRLVIGAHYDVCGNQQGADDNASGVAGLIELANRLKIEQPKLSYCIEMVFYTLEEPPFFRTQQMGSYVHAKSLSDAKREVIGMISIEMIGYYSEERKSQNYPIKLMRLFYPSKGNFIAVVAKKGNKKLVKTFKKGIRRTSQMRSKKLIAPTKMQGVDFSDHLNYWLFGFKAIMITDTAFLRNKNYHKSSDTPESLNYEQMAQTVSGLYGALMSMN